MQALERPRNDAVFMTFQAAEQLHVWSCNGGSRRCCTHPCNVAV